jgi:hypothetical protein
MSANSALRRVVSHRLSPNRTCAFRYASGSPEDIAKEAVSSNQGETGLSKSKREHTARVVLLAKDALSGGDCSVQKTA